MSDERSQAFFPALLRYWRNARGLSQLDLASSAGVSAKHVSFLETGRSKPTREMILRLAATLDVPLREQNALLVSAGFSPAFREGDPDAFDASIRRALDLMLRHHEPYPMLVFDGHYDLALANEATKRLLGLLLGERGQRERNVLKLLFDPDLLRPHVIDWDTAARSVLLRLHRETIHRRGDERLTHLLSALCAYPGVPDRWRTPNLEGSSDATLSLRFRVGDAELGFLTTITVFQAPHDIALEELKIESYFPLDDATEALCYELASLPLQSANRR